MLDLRNTGQNFWSRWSGARTQAHSQTRPVAAGSSGPQQPLAPLEVGLEWWLVTSVWYLVVSLPAAWGSPYSWPNVSGTLDVGEKCSGRP